LAEPAVETVLAAGVDVVLFRTPLSVMPRLASSSGPLGLPRKLVCAGTPRTAASPGRAVENEAVSTFVVLSSVAVVVAASIVPPLVKVASPPGKVVESQAVSIFMVPSSVAVVGTPAPAPRESKRTVLRASFTSIRTIS
jgi:hypothetical protein